MNTPESITRAVAAKSPWTCGTCIFCGSTATFPGPDETHDQMAARLTQQDTHQDTCPWRLARAWVLENPE